VQGSVTVMHLSRKLHLYQHEQKYLFFLFSILLMSSHYMLVCRASDDEWKILRKDTGYLLRSLVCIYFLKNTLCTVTEVKLCTIKKSI
jgi:hypothetical protein